MTEAGREGLQKAHELRRGKPATVEALRNLDLGRVQNWNDPQYRAKMSRISSETMRRTNDRKKNGEFPVWSANSRIAVSAFMREQWRRGEVIKTFKRGVDGFRSKLERRFAEWMNSLGVVWEYEPRRFSIKLNGEESSYLPDFYLPSINHWVEIKGFWYKDAKARVQAFIAQYPYLQFSVLNNQLQFIAGREFPWKK
jgi:Phage endonuclease I